MLMYVAASSALLVVLGLVLGLMLRSQLEARDREELDGKTELVEYLFSELETSAAIVHSTARFAEIAVGHPRLLIGVKDERAWLVEPPLPLRSVIERQKDGAIPFAPRVATVKFVDGRRWLRRIDFGTANGARFSAYLALHVDSAQMLVDQMQRQLIVAGMLGVLASGLLGWFVAKRGLALLATVGRDAERVTAQQLGSPLRAEDAPSEIRALVEAINRMLARLGSSYKTLEEFSADIAQELRTPLHNLRLQTQVTLSRCRSADQYRDILHSNLEGLEHLHRMVVDLLFLARADRGMVDVCLEPVDLRAEADKVAEFFELAAAEAGKTIEVSGTGQACCDRQMTRRAITILLSTAVRYSAPAARIDLRIAPRADGGCEVQIANPCRLLDEAERKRLIRSFARSEGGERQREGASLAYSIVAAIMRLHRGSVHAEATPGGLCIRLVFAAEAQRAST